MKISFKLRHTAAVVLSVALCVLCLPLNAFALNFDEVGEKDCALRLVFAPKETETAADNVDFSIYRVASVNSAVSFTPTEEFAKYNVWGGDATWLSRASTLAGYVARDNLAPYREGTSDEEGKLAFTELEKGLYLVVGGSKRMNGYIYTPVPFLISMPFTEDGYSWLAEVETFCKYTRRRPGTPGGNEENNDPETLEYRVIKVWNDDDNAADMRPEEVTVDLLRDGEVYNTVTLSDANSWRASWSGLDSAASWQVVEREVENYSAVVEQRGGTYVVTNTYSDGDIEIIDPNIPLDDNPDVEIDEPRVPTGELPYTGVLWWPVYPLAVLGMALIIFGIIRRKKWSADNAE